MIIRFFVGLHQPSDARHFDACFVSVKRLEPRRHFEVKDWILDSGSYSELFKYGEFRRSCEDYAAEIRRWSDNGNLLAAVSQEYPCIVAVMKKTGMTAQQHQEKTIERYDRLLSMDLNGIYLMPVLEGRSPEEFIKHIRMYGNRLATEAWVGIGEVGRRCYSVSEAKYVIEAIRKERPDLLLHCFGLKTTILKNKTVSKDLFSADSMAWCYTAWKENRNKNSWCEAKKLVEEIENDPPKEPFKFVMPDFGDKSKEDWAIDFMLENQPPEGYFLAFSGGKDSTVLYDLVVRSGVKFEAYYNATGVDPPEVVKFIRTNYPDIKFLRPEHSFFHYIKEKGFPTKFGRWC